MCIRSDHAQTKFEGVSSKQSCEAWGGPFALLQFLDATRLSLAICAPSTEIVGLRAS